MASKKSSSKIVTVVVVFIILWLAFVGILYLGFKNSPVTEFNVRKGVIGGEKSFLEARVNHCICGSVIWAVLLAVFVIISEKRSKPKLIIPDQSVDEVDSLEVDKSKGIDLGK